jgi:hypothetical protein
MTMDIASSFHIASCFATGLSMLYGLSDVAHCHTRARCSSVWTIVWLSVMPIFVFYTSNRLIENLEWRCAPAFHREHVAKYLTSSMKLKHLDIIFCESIIHFNSPMTKSLSLSH